MLATVNIPHCVSSNAVLYADDTKLYRQIVGAIDPDIVQHDLDNLLTWSTDCLLKFHPDKCKVLKIRNRGKQANECSYSMGQYDYSRTSLETIEDEKDMGVCG